MAHKLVNGVQVQLTEEEIAQRAVEESAWEAGAYDRAMADLRQKRNALLSATDYLALSDNTMSANVKAYRQALRDITEGLTTKEEVEAVEFPTKP
jgi:endonuclease/exonuclease/phosphatase family metal-dependent hydrolase